MQTAFKLAIFALGIGIPLALVGLWQWVHYGQLHYGILAFLCLNTCAIFYFRRARVG